MFCMQEKHNEILTILKIPYFLSIDMFTFNTIIE